MGILKRITALAIGAAIMCTAVNTVFAENNNRGDTVNIKIDGCYLTSRIRIFDTQNTKSE